MEINARNAMMADLKARTDVLSSKQELLLRHPLKEYVITY